MPTERFYRLSEEKRRVIERAAFHEFARVPIDKVSINQIIKEADISRGSFYTYFEDKWDVLGYIFEENKKNVKQYASEVLERSGGDIWEMLERVMERVLDLAVGEEKFHFVKNVMAHLSSEEMMRGMSGKPPGCRDKEDEELYRQVYERCNRNLLCPMDFREFNGFMQIAMFCMGVEVKGIFEGATPQEAKKNFRIKLNFLKWGVCPRQGEPLFGKPD